MIDDATRKLFEGPNFVHLATLREDGRVHLSVIWGSIEGDRVALNSAEGRAWPAHVRRDPRVTLTITNADDPYEYSEIRGHVVEDTHDGADEHIHGLEKKYRGNDRYPLKDGEQRIKFLVEADRVRHRG